MKVKFIREGYFHTPDEMKAKAKKTNAEIVAKTALEEKRKDLVSALEFLVNKYYPNSQTYAFYPGPSDLYAFFENTQTNDWFKSDCQIRYDINMNDKTVLVNIYYGATHSYKPWYIINSGENNEQEIEVNEMLFNYNCYDNLRQCLEAEPYIFSQETLSTCCTTQLHHLCNIIIDYYEEGTKEYELYKELKEFKFIVNKIHMFPGISCDIQICVDAVRSSMNSCIHWYNDDKEKLIDFLYSIFSFENKGRRTLRYLKNTPRGWKLCMDDITNPNNVQEDD